MIWYSLHLILVSKWARIDRENSFGFKTWKPFFFLFYVNSLVDWHCYPFDVILVVKYWLFLNLVSKWTERDMERGAHKDTKLFAFPFGLKVLADWGRWPERKIDVLTCTDHVLHMSIFQMLGLRQQAAIEGRKCSDEQTTKSSLHSLQLAVLLPPSRGASGRLDGSGSRSLGGKAEGQAQETRLQQNLKGWKQGPFLWVTEGFGCCRLKSLLKQTVGLSPWGLLCA